MKAKDTKTQKTKTKKDENLVLPKLSKIITIRESYIKYNFVAPLIDGIVWNDSFIDFEKSGKVACCLNINFVL